MVGIGFDLKVQNKRPACVTSHPSRGSRGICWHFYLVSAVSLHCSAKMDTAKIDTTSWSFPSPKVGHSNSLHV